MWQLLALVLLSLACSYASDRPIVGILSQETYIVSRYIGGNHHSFIAASYVKYLESAGARVVPVWIGQDDDYYVRVVNYTNGILFPGGGTYFTEPRGYGEAARKIYQLAVNLNDRGVYYPVLGVCLGMQALAFAEVGEDIRTDCFLKNVSVPLEFEEGYDQSRLFSQASEDVIRILRTKNVTYNFHKYCLTHDIMKEKRLLPEWRITSSNKDMNQLEFVSSMENTKYPFYGVQFHPEKNIFEFKLGAGIPHTVEAVKASQYFTNFFVEECRKNGNGFPDADLEARSLIYNYNPVYTGLNHSSYEQIYVFDESHCSNRLN